MVFLEDSSFPQVKWLKDLAHLQRVVDNGERQGYDPSWAVAGFRSRASALWLDFVGGMTAALGSRTAVQGLLDMFREELQDIKHQLSQ